MSLTLTALSCTLPYSAAHFYIYADGLWIVDSTAVSQGQHRKKVEVVMEAVKKNAEKYKTLSALTQKVMSLWSNVQFAIQFAKELYEMLPSMMKAIKAGAKKIHDWIDYICDTVIVFIETGKEKKEAKQGSSKASDNKDAGKRHDRASGDAHAHKQHRKAITEPEEALPRPLTSYPDGSEEWTRILERHPGIGDWY